MTINAPTINRVLFVTCRPISRRFPHAGTNWSASASHFWKPSPTGGDSTAKTVCRGRHRSMVLFQTVKKKIIVRLTLTKWELSVINNYSDRDCINKCPVNVPVPTSFCANQFILRQKFLSVLWPLISLCSSEKHELDLIRENGEVVGLLQDLDHLLHEESHLSDLLNGEASRSR